VTTTVVAECYFLDVGQGSCQVIVLPDRSAILIDCGPSYLVLGDLLQRYLKVTRIVAIILSHNHSDHIGGLPGVLQNFRRKIGKIYWLQDMNAKELVSREVIAKLKVEVDAKNCPLPTPLYRHEQDQILFETKSSGSSLRIEILYPTMLEALDAQASGKPNRASAVLILQCGEKRILFTGDAEIKSWRSIYELRDKRAIECDILAIPHHGGQIVRNKRKAESVQQHYESIKPDLEWLYREMIHSPAAVISVGTICGFPGDQHPIPPHIEAVKNSGACVMCTQITTRCCAELETLRPGVLDPNHLPRRSSPTKLKNSDGDSDHVACAGTVLVEIGPDKLSILRQDEHQKAIDSTLSKSSPLCRNVLTVG